MNMIFMGRKNYSAQLLEWTVCQGIDVVAVVTDSHYTNSPTAAKARQLNIPVISMEEAEQMLIDGTQVDLVVSYLFWRKIKKPLIELPKYGCINFHPAILPDYRGTAGYNIAIMDQLNQWGATAHYVDETIDTGRIIEVSKFDFDCKTATAKTLERQTQLVQMDLYKKIIKQVENHGWLESTEQNMSDGIYVSRQQMEDMKSIDLSIDTKDVIDRKIRAFWFPPYDGANIVIEGKRYTLVDSEILKSLIDEDTTYVVE